MAELEGLHVAMRVREEAHSHDLPALCARGRPHIQRRGAGLRLRYTSKRCALDFSDGALIRPDDRVYAQVSGLPGLAFATYDSRAVGIRRGHRAEVSRRSEVAIALVTGTKVATEAGARRLCPGLLAQRAQALADDRRWSRPRDRGRDGWWWSTAPRTMGSLGSGCSRPIRTSSNLLISGRAVGVALADRMPHVVSADDGDWWYRRRLQDDVVPRHPDRATASMADPDRLRTSGTFAEVRPAAYDPRQYIDENERDGVWGSVMYPSQGLVLFEVPVTDVVTAAMQAYNDWLADFCSEDTAGSRASRWSTSTTSTTRSPSCNGAASSGCAGALITVAPPAWQPYRSPRLRPRSGPRHRTSTCRSSLHVATDRADPRVGAAAFRLDVKHVPPSVFVNPGLPGPPVARRPHLLRRLRAVPAASQVGIGRARAGVDPVLPRPSGLHVHRSPAARAGVARASPIPTCSRATSSAATSSRRSSRTRTRCVCSTCIGERHA